MKHHLQATASLAAIICIGCLLPMQMHRAVKLVGFGVAVVASVVGERACRQLELEDRTSRGVEEISLARNYYLSALQSYRELQSLYLQSGLTLEPPGLCAISLLSLALMMAML